MKIRATILIACASLLFLYGNGQNDVASLNINGKNIGEITVAEKPVVLDCDQETYKDATNAVLNIKQSAVISAYKRSISITDENENELYSSNESKSEPGIYNVNIETIFQKLSDQKVLKVFLLEDPLNEKMSVPSRKKLMAELHLK